MNTKKCVVTNPKTGETKAFTTNREAAKYFEVTVESIIRWKKEKVTVDSEKVTVDSEKVTVDSEKVTVEPKQLPLVKFCMTTSQEELNKIHPAEWKLHCPRWEVCKATKVYPTWQCTPGYAHQLKQALEEDRREYRREQKAILQRDLPALAAVGSERSEEYRKKQNEAIAKCKAIPAGPERSKRIDEYNAWAKHNYPQIRADFVSMFDF